MTQEYKVAEGKRIALAESGGAKEIRLTGGSACIDCRHRQCQVCEECSAAKQYSDFWICHRCGELNRRVQNLDLNGVPNELGED